ncbi:MAG: hypothetical protein QOE54_1535, partial [Streptosporangiaceae bacterium]|nr:hypothetical protein [Streptosporangiaceae bacterium]
HTSDQTEALLWVEALVPAGVEGLVIKPTGGRYVGGNRGWWKFE